MLFKKGLLGHKHFKLLNVLDGEQVPPNVIRMVVQTDKFRWSIINNVANYTVDYGDGNTYAGTPSGAVRTVEHTYSSAGLYTVDFIFNDITDLTRFQILDIGTGEFIQSFVNLDTATALSFLSLNGQNFAQSNVDVVGTGVTFIDFFGTHVKNLNLLGVTSNAGSLALSIRSMPELLSLVIPIITSDYASCLLNDNTKVVEYDLTNEGAYAASVYRFSDCDLLETIAMSSIVSTRQVSEFTCNNLPVATGTLDIRRLASLGGAVNVRNTTFDEILFASTMDASALNITSLLLDNNSKIIDLDVSGFGSKFGGLFRAHTCALLESITVPTSTRAVTIEAYGNPNIPNIDVSTLTGLGVTARFDSSGYQTITLPTTSVTASNFVVLYAYNSNITGVQDCTPLANNFAGLIYWYGNPNLTGFLFPTSNNVVVGINISNCSLASLNITPLTGANDNIVISLQNNLFTASAVNKLLADLDAKGWINGSLNIGGTGNAAPDGTSGGYDGLTAKANLVAKGWNITNN